MQRGHFYVSEPPTQMYVEWQRSEKTPFFYPLVLVHGGAHTGACYRTTPDGRPGWNTIFPSRGFDTYVVDLPGHGRSPMPPDFAHVGLDVYADAIIALLERLGGAMVAAHSLGGGVLWRVAAKLGERRNALLKAAFPLAPVPVTGMPGPKVAIPKDVKLGVLPRERVEPMFANSATFPKEHLDDYMKTLVPESPQAVNDIREMQPPPRGLLAGIPSAIIWGEEEAAVDQKALAETAKYLNIPAIRLNGEWDLPGHGHMFMVERDNEKIADKMSAWIREKVRRT